MLENPAGSDLFALTCMIRVWATGRVVSMNFPQYATGLVSPEGLPVLKWTTLWASDERLVESFRTLKCTHQSHAELAGSFQGKSRTELAQVWTHDMCARIVDGTLRVLRDQSSFPVEDDGERVTRSAGRPRVHEPGTVFGCPACQRRRLATDPEHTRSTAPPDQCRYPLVAPVDLEVSSVQGPEEPFGWLSYIGARRVPGNRGTAARLWKTARSGV